jgi:hypothetical protein
MSIGHAAKSSRAAFKKGALGSFLSSPYALECSGINRAAQNGSRSPLKMLTFAAMRRIWPCGNAVGFPLLAVFV